MGSCSEVVGGGGKGSGSSLRLNIFRNPLFFDFNCFVGTDEVELLFVSALSLRRLSVLMLFGKGLTRSRSRAASNEMSLNVLGGTTSFGDSADVRLGAVVVGLKDLSPNVLDENKDVFDVDVVIPVSELRDEERGKVDTVDPADKGCGVFNGSVFLSSGVFC